MTPTFPIPTAILQHTCKVYQEGSATNLHEDVLLNTIPNTGWTRASPGKYQWKTTLPWNQQRVYIPGQSDYSDSGAIAIPLVDTTNTPKGYMIYSLQDISGKIAIEMDTVDLTGAAKDLFDIIGATVIYVPTFYYDNR